MVHRKVVFNIPPDISKGLASGEYIRKGGLILLKNSNQVVKWLDEVDASSTGEVVANLTIESLGSAGITIANFVYLKRNFDKIHNSLSDINQKLDAQNHSKIESGFELAIDAEKMKDKSSRNSQLISARSLLQDGSKIFQRLLINVKKKDPKYFEKSFLYIDMIIQSELGIIRTYLLENEYEIALIRMKELKKFTLINTIELIKNEIDIHVEWYYMLIAATAGLPLVMFLAVKDRKKDNRFSAISKLNKENLKIEEKLLKLIELAQEYNVDLREETKLLIEFESFISGYEYEIEYLLDKEKLKI